jgi:hypothetical protein
MEREVLSVISCRLDGIRLFEAGVAGDTLWTRLGHWLRKLSRYRNGTTPFTAEIFLRIRLQAQVYCWPVTAVLVHFPSNTG